MASYSIEIRKSAAKEIALLPDKERQRIVANIRSLAANPRPMGCEKLSSDDKYHVRQGNYRILYEIHDSVLIVIVVKIAHRREAYR